MRPHAPSILRRLAAALPTLALSGALLVPAPAAAQPIAASAACVPGAPCDALRFTLLLASPAPVSLASLRFTLLTPGWSFVDGPTVAFTAEDALGFGPFGTAEVSDAGTPAAGGAVAFVDLLGQGSSFELLPGASGWLQLAVSAGAIGAGAEPVSFSWEGTDFDGASYAGTVGASSGPPGVVPEPATVLLLGAGLAALGVTAARRRAPAAARVHTRA